MKNEMMIVIGLWLSALGLSLLFTGCQSTRDVLTDTLGADNAALVESTAKSLATMALQVGVDKLKEKYPQTEGWLDLLDDAVGEDPNLDTSICPEIARMYVVSAAPLAEDQNRLIIALQEVWEHPPRGINNLSYEDQTAWILAVAVELCGMDASDG